MLVILFPAGINNGFGLTAVIPYCIMDKLRDSSSLLAPTSTLISPVLLHTKKDRTLYGTPLRRESATVVNDTSHKQPTHFLLQ